MDGAIKTIPYGISDFANMRELNGYYVDNTWGIPLLEQLPYQMFLRPRRFGKSLLLSILHYYYDVNCTSRFDELFGGTWIHEHPTAFRGRYLVMRFDFSKIDGKSLDEIQESFEKRCKTALDSFVEQYSGLLPDGVPEIVTKQERFSDGLDILVARLLYSDKKIYILIDEYGGFGIYQKKCPKKISIYIINHNIYNMILYFIILKLY